MAINPPEACLIEGRIRLLSYNIQTGIKTQRYSDYVTACWKHLLPHAQREQNLSQIAAALAPFDLVCLQESDAGSLRTQFMDLTQYLAKHAAFPYWHGRINRALGQLAQHSSGVLSRHRPYDVQRFALPGIPGRGATISRFTIANRQLTIVNTHLALTGSTRRKQLQFLQRLIQHETTVVITGDFNCSPHCHDFGCFMAQTQLLRAPTAATFPSWQPSRPIDHILVSRSMQLTDAQVLPWHYSDHRPITIELILPN